MQVFCVFRKGFYRCQCGGLFTTPELAQQAAISLIRQEPDDYHDYEVRSFLLDEVTHFHPSDQSGFGSRNYGALIESKEVYNIFRNGTQIVVTGPTFADDLGTIRGEVLSVNTLDS